MDFSELTYQRNYQFLEVLSNQDKLPFVLVQHERISRNIQMKLFIVKGMPFEAFDDGLSNNLIPDNLVYTEFPLLQPSKMSNH